MIVNHAQYAPSLLTVDDLPRFQRTRILQYIDSAIEINAMLRQIGRCFCRIPFKQYYTEIP